MTPAVNDQRRGGERVATARRSRPALSSPQPTLVAMTDAIVIYDGDCGFCRWTLAKLLAWDRRRALRPVALQEPEAAELLAGMPVAEREASWHLVAGGEVRSGGAALAPVLRLLPGGGAPARLADRIPGAIARAYGFVAGHRVAFGKLVSSGMRRRAEARIASRGRRS